QKYAHARTPPERHRRPRRPRDDKRRGAHAPGCATSRADRPPCPCPSPCPCHAHAPGPPPAARTPPPPPSQAPPSSSRATNSTRFLRRRQSSLLTTRLTTKIPMPTFAVVLVLAVLAAKAVAGGSVPDLVKWADGNCAQGQGWEC